MNTKAKAEESPGFLDTALLTLAVLLLLAGVVGFYWLDQYAQWMRVLGLLIVAGIGVAIASQTVKGSALLRFIRDSNAEVRKVVWPTRQETIQTTLVVIVITIITGIMLWLMDMFFGWAMRTLIA